MAKLSSTSVYGNLYVDGEIVNNALDAELGQSIKSLSVNGKTITYTKNNGTTGTITTQDTNTTYGNATTSTSGLMSSADKTKLDGIATNANNYSHPTTSGNKHIPAGGSSGQILRWASDGTAAWGNDNNTTYSTGTASTAGLTKLYTGTGTATDGTMTQSAINTALNGKASSSHTHNSITNQDTRNVNTTPTQMPLGLSVHLKSNSTDGLNDGGTYHSTLMIKGWEDVSGGPWAQMTVTANNNLYFRSSNNDTWNAWRKVSLDGHTHNYAGSSSAGGAANSANTLTTARKINGTSFNGSADITTANWGTARDINGVSVNGSTNYILPIENYYCNIQDNNTKLYHKILESGQVTGSWVDKSIILLVTNAYQGGGHGIVKITLRTNDISSSANASGEIRWLVRSGLAADSISFNIVNQSKNVYMDVFYKCPGTYGGLTWYVLSEGQRGSKHNKVWTKFNTSATSGAYTEAEMKALRSYTATLQTGSDSGQVASANILATARTINGTSFNGSANITTANWGTARTLTVGNTGKSVNGSGNVSWSLSEIGALPLTGGTLSGRLTANGRISAPTAGSSWISGMTVTNATIGISTQQTTSSYHPVLAVKTSGNHVANIGGLGDDFGFYGFKSGRTENATDWSFKINAGTGAVSSTGNITAPTFVGSLSGNASTATKATQDSAGQQINTTYIKGLSVSGKTITYTKGDGTTGTITTQDTNTTYSTGTASTSGLTKLYTATGTATDGTMTQAAINTALNGKANSSHGIHMPSTCNTITDWNSATTTGWYMASGATNAPTANAWYFGEVIAHNTNYVIQTVYQFTASTDAKAIPKYIRAKMNGTWGSWTNVTVAKAVPSNAVFTDTNTWRGVQDNLTSTATDQSLSANQGKVLKGLIDGKAASSHTHNYAGSSSAGGAANSATVLATTRKINGTSFNGSADITTANWGTARTLTIGNTGKSVNGSGNVSWSLSEIGAAPISHNHTSLTGVSNIAFAAGSSDSASMGVSVSSDTTYFDFNLTDDTNTDMWRWRFGAWDNSTSSTQTFNAMTLTATSTTAAKLTVPGTIQASTFSGALSGNATTATTLATARTINGTSFNGSANITTANWGTARTITIGATGKSVNGSGNVSWSLSEIGAAPALALANSYYGMVTNDGNSSNWIRTTQNGIIPYQSNSSGSSSLGTSGWPFSTVYATNFYGTLNGNATHWGGRQVWWGAAGSRPGNGYIQFVW